ncbi:hypothetical protein [Actinocatenispora rupis]|uniref:Uncharacterized protein n=1 Tax=Actinocatenispora rupis TaxID=519421 RepID=A0A8J3NC79_9ACTN|nr:hypothetical protein [Actinocatenispora rupis]GID10139.1 hypothetical protein Aru02nite_10280 [Actinocatenispora rupis]
MTDPETSFRERQPHRDWEIDDVLRPLPHLPPGHRQRRERVIALLDRVTDEADQHHLDYRRALCFLSSDEFSLVVDALARAGSGRLAESLGLTVHRGDGLRPRTAVLVGMVASGVAGPGAAAKRDGGRWAASAADQLLAGGPESRDAALDTTLLLRRAQELDAAEPLGPTFVDECSWYAVPTGDQAAVLDACRLTGAVPVGFREGAALFDAVLAPDTAVLVTPAFDGWTLLVKPGGLDIDLGALSARFGAAHAYGHGFQSGCGDYSTWTVAEHGTVLQSCYYDLYGNDRMGPASRTEMLAWVNGRRPETPRLLAADDPASDNPYGWEFAAEDIAHRLSVSLNRIGPHTTVAGTSLLATPIAS